MAIKVIVCGYTVSYAVGNQRATNKGIQFKPFKKTKLNWEIKGGVLEKPFTTNMKC